MVFAQAGMGALSSLRNCGSWVLILATSCSKWFRSAARCSRVDFTQRPGDKGGLDKAGGIRVVVAGALMVLDGSLVFEGKAAEDRSTP